MKYKITGRQINLIVCLIGVVIFSYTYLNIYMEKNEATEALRLEINAVKEQIAQREKELSQIETVIENTEAVKKEMEQIIAKYPPYIFKEDDFMFVEHLNDTLKISAPAINPERSTVFYTTNIPVVEELSDEILMESTSESSEQTDTAGEEANSDQSLVTEAAGLLETAATLGITAAEEAASGDIYIKSGQDFNTIPSTEFMTGMQSRFTINFKTTYKGLHKLIDYINEYPYRTSINNVSVSFDSTSGNLTGSLELTRYALTGTGKQYEPPFIDGIDIGTDNIFGTNSLSTDETEE